MKENESLYRESLRLMTPALLEQASLFCGEGIGQVSNASTVIVTSLYARLTDFVQRPNQAVTVLEHLKECGHNGKMIDDPIRLFTDERTSSRAELLGERTLALLLPGGAGQLATLVAQESGVSLDAARVLSSRLACLLTDAVAVRVKASGIARERAVRLVRALQAQFSDVAAHLPALVVRELAIQGPPVPVRQQEKAAPKSWLASFFRFA